MGRRKIQIAPITEDRNRSVTFLKRKNGLFKKAYELGVLCSADVAVIVFAHNGKLYEFASQDTENIISKYAHYNKASHERRTPLDFADKDSAGGAGGIATLGGVGEDEDDEEDSGDEGVSEEKTHVGGGRGTRPSLGRKAMSAGLARKTESPAQRHAHNRSPSRSSNSTNASYGMEVDAGPPSSSNRQNSNVVFQQHQPVYHYSHHQPPPPPAAAHPTSTQFHNQHSLLSMPPGTAPPPGSGNPFSPSSFIPSNPAPSSSDEMTGHPSPSTQIAIQAMQQQHPHQHGHALPHGFPVHSTFPPPHAQKQQQEQQGEASHGQSRFYPFTQSAPPITSQTSTLPINYASSGSLEQDPNQVQQLANQSYQGVDLRNYAPGCNPYLYPQFYGPSPPEQPNFHTGNHDPSIMSHSPIHIRQSPPPQSFMSSGQEGVMQFSSSPPEMTGHVEHQTRSRQQPQHPPSQHRPHQHQHQAGTAIAHVWNSSNSSSPHLGPSGSSFPDPNSPRSINHREQSATRTLSDPYGTAAAAAVAALGMRNSMDPASSVASSSGSPRSSHSDPNHVASSAETTVTATRHRQNGTSHPIRRPSLNVSIPGSSSAVSTTGGSNLSRQTVREIAGGNGSSGMLVIAREEAEMTARPGQAGEKALRGIRGPSQGDAEGDDEDGEGEDEDGGHQMAKVKLEDDEAGSSMLAKDYGALSSGDYAHIRAAAAFSRSQLSPTSVVSQYASDLIPSPSSFLPNFNGFAFSIEGEDEGDDRSLGEGEEREDEFQWPNLGDPEGGSGRIGEAGRGGSQQPNHHHHQQQQEPEDQQPHVKRKRTPTMGETSSQASSAEASPTGSSWSQASGTSRKTSRDSLVGGAGTVGDHGGKLPDDEAVSEDENVRRTRQRMESVMRR